MRIYEGSREDGWHFVFVDEENLPAFNFETGQVEGSKPMTCQELADALLYDVQGSEAVATYRQELAELIGHLTDGWKLYDEDIDEWTIHIDSIRAARDAGKAGHDPAPIIPAKLAADPNFRLR